MANDEAKIKQRIELAGEKEYKQALDNAYRGLKVLRSELKAETAELGKNATEQQKNEVRVKNLQKQIAEQEKIVKTYTEALQEVREKYADNEAEIAKWEIKLNNARATLANMQDGLQDIGQEFGNVKGSAESGVVAAKSFADAFGGLGEIGENISGAVEDIFTGMIDIVKDAVGELWGLITDTAAKANNWTDLANYYGSSAEQMQLLDRAINESAGDFSKFTNLVNQLSFGGKNKKIAEWFGISDANYTDNIEYTMDVLQAMSDKYKEWGTGGKWDNAMADIFGMKKSADVSWFVTNFDTILAKRDELQEKGGYLMTEDELETMNQAHVQLNTLEEKWDALKAKFGVGFGTTTLKITAEAEGALDALAAYFEADTPEEREQAISDLEENITEIFQTVADAIRDGIEILEKVSEDLKESKDPIVQGVGNILGGLVDALKWFTEDNAHNAVLAMEVLAGFWVAGKGLQMASTIAEMAANIKTIQLFKGIGGLTGGAGAAAGGAAAGEAAGAAAGEAGAGAAGAGAAGGGLLTTLIGFGGAYLIGKAAEWAADMRNNHAEEVRGTEEHLAAGIGDDEALANAFMEYLAAHAEMSKLDLDADESVWAAAADRVEKAAEALAGLDPENDLLGRYSDWRQENSYGSDYWELPADWWKQAPNEDGVTSQDIQSLNRMPEAVKSAVSGLIGSIQINLDGNKVADLLTDRVSERVARDIDD